MAGQCRDRQLQLGLWSLQSWAEQLAETFAGARPAVAGRGPSGPASLE